MFKAQNSKKLRRNINVRRRKMHRHLLHVIVHSVTVANKYAGLINRSRKINTLKSLRSALWAMLLSKICSPGHKHSNAISGGRASRPKVKKRGSEGVAY